MNIFSHIRLCAVDDAGALDKIPKLLLENSSLCIYHIVHHCILAM